MFVPPPEINDTRKDSIVKSKISGDTPRKRKFEVQLQGQFLSALESYARKRRISENAAFREMLEFRLVEVGELPDWWLERTRPKKL
jgi:hypothetical protein